MVEMCAAWCDATFTIPNTNFGEQIIWNNSLIKINNVTIYYKRFHQAGVIHVKDLFNDDGTTVSYDQLMDKFELNQFLFTLLSGIISAIPSGWKNFWQVDYNNDNGNDHIIDSLSKTKSASKLIYPLLIQNISVPPRACAKWNATFSFSEENWSVIYKIPFIALSETKIQYFQFRFLHRVLGTNRLLSLMNTNNSSLCTFCKIETETIEHLFWNCYVTSSFLLDCEQLFFGRQFILTKRDFFFGYNLELNHPMNFFILHCKYYVYSCKLNTSPPSVNEFFYKMKFVMKVEHCIHSKPDVSKRSLQRFNQLKNCFTNIPELFTH